MLAAGPEVSWQQHAPGPVPSSSFPGQGGGHGAASLLAVEGCAAVCMGHFPFPRHSHPFGVGGTKTRSIFSPAHDHPAVRGGIRACLRAEAQAHEN